jgi:putative addiction module killer protein
MRMNLTYEILIFEAATGQRPFLKWLSDLKDKRAQAAVDLRLELLKMGNFGQCRVLGDGLHELKIDLGPGYRIYFGKIGNNIVLLLCGGDKGSQQRDILKAKEYLKQIKIKGIV